MRLLIIIFFFNFFCFSQNKNEPQLISSEFYIEKTDIFSNGNEYVFIDKVFSKFELGNDFYYLEDESTLRNLLPDVSSDSLKFRYYLCDVYNFVKHTDLVKVKTILCKDVNMLTGFKKTDFKSLKIEKNIRLKGICNSKDILIDKVVFFKDICNIKIVIESIGEFYYVSIFNGICQNFEKVKYHKNDFSMFVSDMYFMVKTKKALFFYTEGNANPKPN